MIKCLIYLVQTEGTGIPSPAFAILVNLLMWHNDQKSVCALVLAIVNEAQTA